MKNLTYKKGFTIAEITIALILIAFISMLLMPTIFSDTQTSVLMTSLNKNYTALQDIHKAIPLLQARGKISPGRIDVTRFMQAVVLTQKVIGLNHDGTILTGAGQNKFSQYIGGYTTAPRNIINPYTQFSLDAANIGNTTIILKNGVYISRYTDSGTDYLMVDVNGKKSPNTTGKDIFFFEIENNYNYAADGLSNSVFQPIRGNCNIGGNFAASNGCANQYLETGTMD